jgi:non-heme Fe2+,alpha-ketoglutarate-dependent halogenase
MSKVLTASEVEAYNAKGYHLPVDVLSKDEVAACRRELEAYERNSGGPIKGEMRHKSHLLFPWINDLMRHPRVLDAIEDVLGPNLLVWSTSFSSKSRATPATFRGIRTRPTGDCRRPTYARPGSRCRLPTKFQAA